MVDHVNAPGHTVSLVPRCSSAEKEPGRAGPGAARRPQGPLWARIQVLSRDFPHNLRPTTIAGLLGDSIAVREKNKRFPGRSKGAFAHRRTGIAPGTAFIPALGPARDTPVPSPLHPPAVSSCVGVIRAQAPAA